MADDIVKYLRLSRTRFNRNAEAADEIERLREEVSRLTLLANLWEAEFNAAVNAITGKAVRGD
jgi:uncharacterized protein YeeX (DUF496 family)